MPYKESQFEAESIRDLLKRGTHDIHSVADSLFTDELVKKKISLKTYREFLSQLYFFYTAMEEELESNKDHPIVGPVHFPDELNRVEHIKEDLEYFYGDSWETDIQCLPATAEYVDRVHHLGKEKPHLLIAHSYVRYLGDVSGGQILKKIIKRMYHLPDDGCGVQFFEFENIDCIPKFKDFYNARMNNLEVDDEMKQDIVQEAQQAFKNNIGIFKAIIEWAESQPDGYMQITDSDKPVRIQGCPIIHRAGAQCPVTNIMDRVRRNATMFAVTSASTVAVVFALALSYYPKLHEV